MKEIEILRSLGACKAAVGNEEGKHGWLEDQPDYETAWKVCPRGDWMLWLIGRLTDTNDEPALRKLTLAKVGCAKLIFHLIKDKRSRKAVKVAEQFGKGKATRKELDAAAIEALNSTYSTAYAYAEAAYYTAYSAADARAGTGADTQIAARVATASAYADTSYCITNAYAIRRDILAKCGEEVRKVFPNAPKLTKRI